MNIQNEIHRKNSVFREFPSMKHGWVNRGDLNDYNVKEKVELALGMACDFMRQNLSSPIKKGEADTANEGKKSI